MIVSYRGQRTRDFAVGKRVKAFSGIERAARLKLDRLEAAVALKDLAVLPGNRLEGLKGDRKGQFSIRIMASGDGPLPPFYGKEPRTAPVSGPLNGGAHLPDGSRSPRNASTADRGIWRLTWAP